jgi:subtilisin family serine protease
VAPGVKLLVGKVLDNAGEGFDDNILSGIAWPCVLGARVINLSLGSERDLDGWFSWDYEVLAKRAAEGSTPAILIAAAGNDSDRNAEPQQLAPVDNPAAAPSIVAVAACDAAILPGWFSNAELDTIGLLDLTAPGVGIYSSYNDGSFRRLDGTSMAAPHVTGLAALRLELNPSLSAEVLRAELREAVRPPPRPAARRDYGQGLAIAP